MSGKRVIVGGVERFALPMSPNTVRCDVEGCGAETYVERHWQLGGKGAGLARTEAASKGWGFVDGKDLCPEHLKEHLARGP